MSTSMTSVRPSMSVTLEHCDRVILQQKSSLSWLPADPDRSVLYVIHWRLGMENVEFWTSAAVISEPVHACHALDQCGTLIGNRIRRIEWHRQRAPTVSGSDRNRNWNPSNSALSVASNGLHVALSQHPLSYLLRCQKVNGVDRSCLQMHISASANAGGDF